MLPLQDPGGVEFGPLLQKLLKGLALFFFIGLPILKGLRDSRRQEKERKRAGTEPSAPSPPKPQGPTWEELLRGEVRSEEAPRVPPPLPVPAPETRVPQTGTLVSLEKNAPPMLSEENLETEGASDEEALAEEAIARREREEFQRQQDVARRQRQAGSSHRESVEPVRIQGVDLAAAPAHDLGAASAPSELTRTGTRPRIARSTLVRAMVMSEILGPPIGLGELDFRRAPGSRST